MTLALTYRQPDATAFLAEQETLLRSIQTGGSSEERKAEWARVDPSETGASGSEVDLYYQVDADDDDIVIVKFFAVQGICMLDAEPVTHSDTDPTRHSLTVVARGLCIGSPSEQHSSSEQHSQCCAAQFVGDTANVTLSYNMDLDPGALAPFNNLTSGADRCTWVVQNSVHYSCAKSWVAAMRAVSRLAPTTAVRFTAARAWPTPDSVQDFTTLEQVLRAINEVCAAAVQSVILMLSDVYSLR